FRRLPRKHAALKLAVDTLLIVSGERDVAVRGEVPHDPLHVIGWLPAFRMDDDGWIRTGAVRARTAHVNEQVVRGDIIRPRLDPDRFPIGVNEILIASPRPENRRARDEGTTCRPALPLAGDPERERCHLVAQHAVACPGADYFRCGEAPSRSLGTQQVQPLT